MKTLLAALLLSPALCAAAPLTSADLDAFFSGNAALPEDKKPSVVPPLPQPEDAIVNPAQYSAWELKELEKHGSTPKGLSEEKVVRALSLLMSVDGGRDVCRGASPNGCSLLEFRKYGVEIRIKDVPGAHAVTPTYYIGTKKVITVDSDMFTYAYGDGDMAAVLAHELSHVQDVGRFQTALPQARLATEQKAFLASLDVYTQIYNADASQVTDQLGMHMYMYAWHRKFEGGPDLTLTYQGKNIRLSDFMARTLPNVEDGAEFVEAMTRDYYPESGFFTVGVHTVPTENALKEVIKDRIAGYKEWRDAANMTQDSYWQNHKPPHHPSTPTSNNGSGGSTGGNGWTNNPVPVTPPPPVQPPKPPKPPPPPPPPPVDDDPPPTWSDDPVDIGPDNPLYPH